MISRTSQQISTKIGPSGENWLIIVTRITLCVLGGKDVVDNCVKYMNDYGRPAAGQAFRVSPGRLHNCKHIIYAVIPPWQMGTAGELKHIFDAIWNSLRCGVSLGASRIAVATVYGGYPTETACTQVVDGIQTFLVESPDALEIILIDVSEKTINCFHESLVSCCGMSNVRLANDVRASSVGTSLAAGKYHVY